MISLKLRLILVLLAIGYGVIGAMMFVIPVWAAENFTWRVSPFAAMTIGGWCLGNAWAAAIVAQRRDWPVMLCPIIYLCLVRPAAGGRARGLPSLAPVRPARSALHRHDRS